MNYISEIDKLTDHLADISVKHKSFQMQIQGLGAFYKRKFPSVLFLNLIHCEELSKLADDVIQQAELIGFKKEDRAYKPHLTLARIKYINDIERFKSFLKSDVKQIYEVRNFCLIESELTSFGPKYKTLETFNFLV